MIYDSRTDTVKLHHDDRKVLSAALVASRRIGANDSDVANSLADSIESLCKRFGVEKRSHTKKPFELTRGEKRALEGALGLFERLDGINRLFPDAPGTRPSENPEGDFLPTFFAMCQHYGVVEKPEPAPTKQKRLDPEDDGVTPPY